MRTWAFKLVAVLAIAATMGCGKGEKTSRGSVRTNRDPGLAGNSTTQPPGPGQPFTKTYGQFTNYSTDAVKKLVSATMNPETDMVLPLHGIAVLGDIRLSGSTTDIRAVGSGTAEIATGSEFAMYIIDDLTYTQKVEAITIGFKQSGQNGYSVSGQVSGGGNVQMTFGDNYGDVYINGTVNTNTQKFTGTVEFKNKVGSAAEQRIQLGTIDMPLCGFFHCQ